MKMKRFSIGLLAFAGAWCAQAVEVRYSLPHTAGSVLEAGVVYRVTKNTTIYGARGCSALVLTNGTAVIDIQKGCQLDLHGGDAADETGAGAGIQLPETASLVLMGEGLVTIKGGDAVDGKNGIDGVSKRDGSCGRSYGGNGGIGGGGAGSGIGSEGGLPGAGGVGGGMSCTPSASTPGSSGGNGFPGVQGKRPPEVGRLYLLGKVSASLSGGKSGKSGRQGDRGSYVDAITARPIFAPGLVNWISRGKVGVPIGVEIRGFMVGAGGAGGGGYGGLSGSGFGPAGSGGSGGGGGGSAALTSMSFDCKPSLNIIKDIIEVIKLGKFLGKMIAGKIANDINYVSGNDGGSECFAGWNKTPESSRSIYNGTSIRVEGGRGGSVQMGYVEADRNRLSGRFYNGSESSVKIDQMRAGTIECGFDSGIRTKVTIENGEGATGGLSDFTATLCQRVPNLPVPKRGELIFRGYYSGYNGEGRQYFLATGEPTMPLWDEYDETRTLYAYWTEKEICGLTVDGYNPLTEESELKPGVKIDKKNRIITIGPSSTLVGPHVVSGFDDHGYRLRIEGAANVVLSNVVIRLPVQDPLLKDDIRSRVPLCVDSLIARIGIMGENLLSATEGSWTNGFPDVEVPAVCLAGGGVEFHPSANGPAVLRLSAAGGAPAILRYADVARMVLPSGEGGCVFNGGTYVVEPSRMIFDSGRKEQGLCRYVTPRVLDFSGSIVAEVAWRSQTALEESSTWYRDLVKPYGEQWKNAASIFGGSVSSGEAKFCTKTPYGRGYAGDYEWLHEPPELGEVQVNLHQAGVTNDVISVTFFNGDFSSSDRYSDYDFTNLSVLEGGVHLWLKTGVEQYFSIADELFKATPKAGERVIAERVGAAVRRVSSGKRYPTFSAAIRDLKNGPVASSETLELLRDIHESVSVKQMCDVLTIDGGNFVISNTASATSPMFYQHEDATNQTLILTNVVLAGFSSATEPMISAVGRLRLTDCDFANDKTSVELVRSRSGLEADSLDVYGSEALTALKIADAGDCQTVIDACSIQGKFQEEVTVESGLLELGGDAEVKSFRLGLTGQLAYRDEPCTAISLHLDLIRRRAVDNPVLVVNRYGYPTNALSVYVGNIEYGCWRDNEGNIRLFDSRGIVYMATPFKSETEEVVTNSAPIGAFGTYNDILSASYGPMITAWTLRKIYLESNEVIEGTREESITIPAGQCHELGSCELAFSNSVETASRSTSMRGTEDFECEPVTLDCVAHVEGMLKIGNVRFSKPIELGTNGILIVGDEFDLTNSVLAVRLANPLGKGWIVTSPKNEQARYSLEDIVSRIRLVNGGYRWTIEDDPNIGKRIVVEVTEGARVALVRASESRLFPTTSSAFASAVSNDVIRLLTDTTGGEVSNTVPLALGTRLGGGQRIIVNSAAYNGAAVLEPEQPTRLDASQGSLTVESGSVVQLTNIVISGALTLDGAGRIDLLGWTGDPILLNPKHRGLVASNVPDGKLTLADGVPGRLWFSAESNAYYSAGIPLDWNFVQTDNGCGTLYVTNLFGEASSYYLDPTNYVSIASQGLARVQLEDAKLGVSTNVEVVVVYCDLVSGIFKLPEGYVFEYLAEGEITEEDGVDVAEKLAKTSWKRLEATDVSADVAAIEELRNVKATATEGTEELAYDASGNVITNRPTPKLALATPKNLGGALESLFKLVPRDIAVDAMSGRIGVRFYRDHANPRSYQEVFFTRLMNDEERVDSINRWAKRFNSAFGVVEALANDGASGGAKKIFDTVMSDVSTHLGKRVADTSWYKGKGHLAQFSTQAGINAAFTCVGNLIKNAVSPVQFQGKYYTPAMAVTAYEACIAKNDADAAVHFQAHCQVPSYTVTNGTLRLSGKFEGGFGSVIYGVIANGKQWTSGTTVWEAIGAVKDKTIEVLWGVYYMKVEKDFSRLAKTTGSAVGNFVAGLIKWARDPYCATPEDKDKAMFYVNSGTKLCLEDFDADWDESGAMVDVRSGGVAEVKRVKLAGGYSLDKALFGVFSVRTGGKLLLEDVEAVTDLTVLGAESGVDLTVKDGYFDRSTFDLRGADLKLGSASTLKSEIRVIGMNKEGEAFALGTGANQDEYWKNFRSTDDKTLVAKYSAGKIYWSSADPIGRVGGSLLHYDIGFSDLSKMEALIRIAGDSVYVTFLKDVGLPDDWKFPMTERMHVKGGRLLQGNGGNRAEPLFHVAAGQKLELSDMVFSGFCSTQVPLLDAPGGEIRLSNCDFRGNRMTSLLNMSNQTNLHSWLSGFYATNDQSACGIRFAPAGHPGYLILDTGIVSNKVGLTVCGEGILPLSGNFAFGSITLEGKTALAYNGTQPPPFALLGSSEHLTGGHCVIDNGSRAGVRVWANKLTVLNEGYQAVDGADNNVYLQDPRQKPTLCKELVYNPTNDIFSVTNGIIPSIGDTNWMARTVSGTNDVFRYGRLARTALVDVNNGDIIVNCRGTDYTMSGIGATATERAAATDRLLSRIGDILEDGSVWFEGAVASNVTAQVIAACLTKTELRVTEKDIYDALMYCTARFAYDGELYLQSEADAVFGKAIESERPVTVLRDVTIAPYTVGDGERLTLNVTNHWTTSAFSNEIVNVEQAFKWVATMRILPVIEQVGAIRERGIYSSDPYEPAITVLSNAVCSLDGLVMTNDWKQETVDIERGGILELHGDTVIPSVESVGRSLRAGADFTGSVGVEGRASCAGVTFAQAEDLKGRFYSNSRSFELLKNGERLKWNFTGNLEELKPVFTEDGPLSISMTNTHRLVAHLFGTINNAEPGLWYYFEDSTNLTDYAAVAYSAFSPMFSGEYRVGYWYNVQTNAVGAPVDNARFFRFRIADKPLND